MILDIELPIRIEPQPDDTTCGPTCLHAVYDYYGDDISLADVIRATRKLDAGGTLAVFLACHALQRGYNATIYTYNLGMFDPSWFGGGDIDIGERLRKQASAHHDKKLQHATEGYLEFLELGGKLRFTDLTGLSSTYLYRSRRVSGPRDLPDDIHGAPCGHFVVLSGYHRKHRTVLVADPYLPNPVARGESFYSVSIDRVICAVLLGVLTHDANLLVIQEKH